jgi:hypothetical protein
LDFGYRLRYGSVIQENWLEVALFPAASLETTNA